MKAADRIPDKIHSRDSIIRQVIQWRVLNKKIAFTNGCFDILHRGHIYSLTHAAKEADYLVIGVNSDASVKKLKGGNRPINDAESRAMLLACLVMVDAVVIFDEDTPLELIKDIRPDILVKGGDYKIEEIAGSKEVIANGGKVILNPVLKGFSTSAIINRAEKSRPKN